MTYDRQGSGFWRVKMSGQVSESRSTWWRHAWVLPSVFGAFAVGFLCWGAWNYGYDPHWLTRGYGWWQTLLQPGQNLTLIVTMALWIAALSGYWWPRRRDRLPIGLIAVVVMVVVAAILGTASYVPCRGHMSTTGVMFWILQLYVGSRRTWSTRACSRGLGASDSHRSRCNLGRSLAGCDPAGAVAGGSGALAPALRAVAVPLRAEGDDIHRARRAHAPSAHPPYRAAPLLQRHCHRTGRKAPAPRWQARATGARVIIGQPAMPGLLQPILASWRGCTLERIYALRSMTAENDAVLKAISDVLGRYPPSAENHPHLVARIDDPRHANHWRGSHGASLTAFEDALSPAETTAYTLIDATCGPPRPAHHLRRQQSDFRGPRRARSAEPGASRARVRSGAGERVVQAARHGRVLPPPDPLPISQVILMDPASGRHPAGIPRRHPHGPFRESMVTARIARWEDELLRALDAMPDDAPSTAVIIANGASVESMHRVGRLARLHPDTWIYIESPTGGAEREVIFNRLRLFQSSLLVAGDLPEDTWMRVARHWHGVLQARRPAVTRSSKGSS